MRKYKSKGKKRVRYLLAVGNAVMFKEYNGSPQTLDMRTEDGRRMPIILPEIPAGIKQNLVLEWWE